MDSFETTQAIIGLVGGVTEEIEDAIEQFVYDACAQANSDGYTEGYQDCKEDQGQRP